MPTNWTVLRGREKGGQRVGSVERRRGEEGREAHLEKLEPTVQSTTRRKYQVPMSPFGKLEMRSIEMAAQARRVHIAMSHCGRGEV